jgi:putative peptidoglycan lipid II flippase
MINFLRQPNGLVIASAIVSFGFLGSRILGVVRTSTIADTFGMSPELDAYWVAFRIPDLIFQVLAGATLGSAFIPVFTRLTRRESDEKAWDLAGNIVSTVLIITIILCLLMLLIAPWIVPLFSPGLGEDIGREKELTDKAIYLTRIMLLSPLLLAVSGMITGISNARQQFFLPALAPMFYNLGIIFGALVLAKHWGIEGLTLGVLIGSALHLVIQIPGIIHTKIWSRFRINLRDKAATEVRRLMAPRVIGLIAGQLNFVVTTTFFASKVGSSAISSMTYAWLIASLPVALFGMALSTAAFPRMAEQAAEKNAAELSKTISRVLRTMMFLTIPAALGLAFLRDPVTAVILERGAFTSGDTALTAAALGFLCIGIVPQAGIEIHSRAFYVFGNTKTPVLLTVLALGINILLSALLWDRMGINGLALSLAVSSWIEWGILYTLYARKEGTLEETRDDLLNLAKFAICGSFMALALGIVLPFIKEGSTAITWLSLTIGIAAGAIIYLGFARIFKINEERIVRKQLNAFIQRFR